MPAASVDTGDVLQEQYTYDAHGNVENIYNWNDPSRHRYLQYDDMDRLTAAGSQVFGGDHWHRFSYDVLDNLKSWKLAGVKDYANYHYEAGTNRLLSIQDSGGASIIGLGYDVQDNLHNKNGQGYDFDYGNRLREVKGQEFYRYDGHGRRVMAGGPTTLTVSQYSQSTIRGLGWPHPPGTSG